MKERTSRYWSSNGFGIAVVAIVSMWKEGEDGEPSIGDWAAYIGADDGFSEESCVEFTRNYGCKLVESDARHFFPDITLPYRR